MQKNRNGKNKYSIAQTFIKRNQLKLLGFLIVLVCKIQSSFEWLTNQIKKTKKPFSIDFYATVQ